eukprot:6183707-Pleurochrysis_carterae.AAC.2
MVRLDALCDGQRASAFGQESDFMALASPWAAQTPFLKLFLMTFNRFWGSHTVCLTHLACAHATRCALVLALGFQVPVLLGANEIVARGIFSSLQVWSVSRIHT